MAAARSPAVSGGSRGADGARPRAQAHGRPWLGSSWGWGFWHHTLLDAKGLRAVWLSVVVAVVADQAGVRRAVAA